MSAASAPASDDRAPPTTVNAERIEFISRHDGQRDWYLVVPGRPDQPCVVNLHGHGSSGDQLWLRPDIRPNLDAALHRGRTVLSPNLRGNAWMSPAATADLAQILETERQRRPWTKTLFAAGSMGATSALAFAVQHPELVDGVVALGAATDIARYEAWCRSPDAPPASAGVRAAIAAAIATAYGESDRSPHSASGNAPRLTMPVVLLQGEADTVIPVEEARDLAAKLTGSKTFVYREIPGGDHDSPLKCWEESMALLEGMVGQ